MRQVGTYGTTVIERPEWAALNPTGPYAGVNPYEGNTGHWEGPSLGWPWAHEACYSMVRSIQRFHQQTQGWIDIAYNLVVCPHGYIFMGRGPNARSAGHGEPGNTRSYAICFLSGTGDEFTPEQSRAWADARDMLVAEGGAAVALYGHRDWMATQCPGDERYDWIHAGAVPIGAAPAPTPDPPPVWTPAPQPPPVLGDVVLPTLWYAKPMQRGRNVRFAQAFMLYTAAALDGVFGPHTRDGVIWCQDANGLPADGVVGKQTWTLFVQAYLTNFLGAGLVLDGDFGPATTAAVQQFQANYGLTADGIVGQYTAGVMTAQ